MQNTHILKPNEWMWKTIDPNSKEKLIKSLVEPSDEFRKTRDVFIKSCIKIVFNQHTKQPDCINEFLSKQVVAGNEKRCTECGRESDVSNQICRNSGGKFTMLKKLRLIPTEVFLNIIQSCQIYLSKQGSQILSILIGTITSSKLFNLLVLDQVLDSMDKGIENG